MTTPSPPADAMTRDKQTLTHSRIDTFKTCRRKHWFSYEQIIRPIDDAKPLRMGTAFHDAMEVLGNDGPLDQATEAVFVNYDVRPDTYDQNEWEIERETVLRLVCGYFWRWEGQTFTHVATELAYSLPLVNPDTGAASTIWTQDGKIDGIIRLEDNRLAVMEHKLLGEDVASDSWLWRRLRIDHQITTYVVAARRLGYAVDCVLYDVARKPTIRPTDVPILDELGAKIVLNQFGDRVKTEKGSWRQVGSTEHGYVLQTRPMNASEWGEKLSNDIAERPETYFARVEIPRLDQDLAEFEAELWDIQRVIRDAQLNDRHFRTCNFNTCKFCCYFDICTNGWKPTDALPGGFVRLDDPHPELNRDKPNVVSTPASAAEAAPAGGE